VLRWLSIGKALMAQADQKVLQYLNEAYASERSLARVLESQIALAPRGALRTGLITHLGETKRHAAWVSERLIELGQPRKPRTRARGFAESVAGQVAAFSKTPLDLARGADVAEKVLKNARDACGTEALEIATYTAIEQVAKAAGDTQTARLAESIRAEEEGMLALLLAELPVLAQSVLDGSFDLAETGAADAAREVVDAVRDRVQTVEATARDTVAAVRGDEPWEGYDAQTVPAIKAALADADAGLIRTVYTYEKAHKARAGVLKAVDRDLAHS
jgi:ferritin-like metal-binding protein YciE